MNYAGNDIIERATNSDDYLLASNIINSSSASKTLTASRSTGDYNDNAKVDNLTSFDDYQLWKANFGSTTQLAAEVDDADGEILFDNCLANLANPTQADGDLNQDGDIDTGDLDLMFGQLGLETPW